MPLALPTVVLCERREPQRDGSLYSALAEEGFQECVLLVASPESKWLTKQCM